MDESGLYSAKDNHTGLSLVSAVTIKLRVLLERWKQVMFYWDGVCGLYWNTETVKQISMKSW